MSSSINHGFSRFDVLSLFIANVLSQVHICLCVLVSIFDAFSLCDLLWIIHCHHDHIIFFYPLGSSMSLLFVLSQLAHVPLCHGPGPHGTCSCFPITKSIPVHVSVTENIILIVKVLNNIFGASLEVWMCLSIIFAKCHVNMKVSPCFPMSSPIFSLISMQIEKVCS